jgi:hypothetical protein
MYLTNVKQNLQGLNFHESDTKITQPALLAQPGKLALQVGE